MNAERPDRIRRPPLARTGPIRRASALLGAAAPPSQQERDGERTDDVLSRSVELGYRVVDAYVRRGQEAAQRLSGGSMQTSDLVADARALAGRMVRAASELASVWGDLFDLTNQRPCSTGTDAAVRAPVPQTMDTGASASPTMRLQLRVRSPYPVEATLDLQEIPAAHSLVAPPLRGGTPDAPPLRGMEVQREGDHALSLALTVPPDQPPGTYVGPLLDDDANVPVGWLTVTIGDGSHRE